MFGMLDTVVDCSYWLGYFVGFGSWYWEFVVGVVMTKGLRAHN